MITFLVLDNLVSAWLLYSSIMRELRSSLRSSLMMTWSMILSSTFSFVTLLLVIRPVHFCVNPFATIRPCLSIIPARIHPFGVWLCGSSGIYSGPNLLLESICMIIVLPNISALAISASRATKNGILSESVHDSWGPYPDINLICLFLIWNSMTKSSKSSQISVLGIN